MPSRGDQDTARTVFHCASDLLHRLFIFQGAAAHYDAKKILFLEFFKGRINEQIGRLASAYILHTGKLRNSFPLTLFPSSYDLGAVRRGFNTHNKVFFSHSQFAVWIILSINQGLPGFLFTCFALDLFSMM